MTELFFERAVVPVANREDAAATATALVENIDDSDSTVIAVHVIEKADGGMDKASVEQRKLFAQDVFEVLTEGLADTDITLETEIRYGTDVASTLIDAAQELNASAIVFTPRGGSRWRKLLTGDVSHNLIENSDIPIVVISDEGVSEA
ncbi:universal stress protein [Halobellus rarus]|uniref:Universal stress protein n=1 Tax=Halobellus rarus TaxID=1126237 RepID=A0ABD6CKW8_9EURY|nr:universal stress protein [Halobellus rarus]